MPRRNVTEIAAHHAAARYHHSLAEELMDEHTDAAYWFVIARHVLGARQAYIAAAVANGTIEAGTEPTTEQVLEMSILGQRVYKWLAALADTEIVALAIGEGFPAHLALMVSAGSLRAWLNPAYGEAANQTNPMAAALRRYAEKYSGLVEDGTVLAAASASVPA
ncbi:hypothetical protein [Planomonospora sp. ID82291]|uniref:hypothetical protein n=1 Tax=Planomonospora sp. ID82291 TaxID=2738136 RepID=UPI0018C36C8F|nr:hypothetical protein [Planomonospora sp. ID82291]MBG0818305.1 hypothetical protein [Planomonospora sp. ID82291]